MVVERLESGIEEVRGTEESAVEDEDAGYSPTQ